MVQFVEDLPSLDCALSRGLGVGRAKMRIQTLSLALLRSCEASSMTSLTLPFPTSEIWILLDKSQEN